MKVFFPLKSRFKLWTDLKWLTLSKKMNVQRINLVIKERVKVCWISTYGNCISLLEDLWNLPQVEIETCQSWRSGCFLSDKKIHPGCVFWDKRKLKTFFSFLDAAPFKTKVSLKCLFYSLTQNSSWNLLVLISKWNKWQRNKISRHADEEKLNLSN